MTLLKLVLVLGCLACTGHGHRVVQSFIPIALPPQNPSVNAGSMAEQPQRRWPWSHRPAVTPIESPTDRASPRRFPFVARMSQMDDVSSMGDHEAPLNLPPLKERVFLVTGATDGIGKFTAEELAKEGCTVLVHGRNPSKVADVVTELQQWSPNVQGFVADLSSLAEVRRLAAEVRKAVPVIHGLSNNAGTFAGDYTFKRKVTVDGNEYSLAVNVLAPFLLTSLLLDRVAASGAGRVIVTSSYSSGSNDKLFDLQCEHGWSGRTAYELSKLCDAMMAMEMHAKYGNPPWVTFHTMDPGTIDTKMLRADWGGGGASVRTALTTFKMLTENRYQETSGTGEVLCRREDRASRRRLWEQLVQLTGASWPDPGSLWTATPPSGGARLPFLYGTAWKKDLTDDFVVEAVRLGFRGIDTACQPKHYREDLVGVALARLAKEGVPREQLWVQTKFTPLRGQDPNNVPYDARAPLRTQVEQSISKSLENLQTHRIDSLLLHSPLPTLEETLEVWEVFERAVDAGTVGQLGIANCYDTNSFMELYSRARVKPRVLQNRFYQQSGYDEELRALCLDLGITYQTFWTLTANPQILRAVAVKRAASRLKATPEQVLFRWLIQSGYQPLTGTTSSEHMQQDLEVTNLKLSDKEMTDIKVLFTTS